MRLPRLSEPLIRNASKMTISAGISPSQARVMRVPTRTVTGRTLTGGLVRGIDDTLTVGINSCPPCACENGCAYDDNGNCYCA